MKRKKDYKYTCMACTQYGLMQYLLIQNEKDAIENTFYFIDDEDAIPRTIGMHLDSCYTIDVIKQWKGNQNVFRFLSKFFLGLTKHIRYPYLRNSQIFAQDLNCNIAILIGHKKYSLIAEHPEFMTNMTNINSAEYIRRKSYRDSLRGRIDSLLLGPICTNAYGENNQCTDIYLTEENSSPILRDKKVHIFPLQLMWDRSSETKRQMILDVFNLNFNDLNIFSKYSIVFFTQPIVNVFGLTKEEYRSLLERIFSKFDTHDLLIKTHPLDTFEYEKFFPSIVVFRKKINIQLCQLAGARIRKALTISSTAVQLLPEDTEVIWLGTSVHPKIEKVLGKNFTINRPYSTMSI